MHPEPQRMEVFYGAEHSTFGSLGFHCSVVDISIRYRCYQGSIQGQCLDR